MYFHYTNTFTLEVITQWLVSSTLFSSQKEHYDPEGFSTFVFGRDVLLGIWKWTHTNIIFWRKSDPFICQVGPILDQILTQITHFLLLKVGKNFENRPIQIPNFAWNKGIIDIPGGWFCYPCLQHAPIGSFWTEYHLWLWYHKYCSFCKYHIEETFERPTIYSWALCKLRHSNVKNYDS